MNNTRRSFAALIILFNTCAVNGQILEDQKDVGKEVESGTFWVPYIFKTESMENGLGLAFNGGLFAGSGSLFLAGYGTANDSWGLRGIASNYQLGGSRWFATGTLGFESNTEQRFYGDAAFLKGEIEGGTHDSDPDDFLFGPGETSTANIRFEYVLPIGDGTENIVARYKTDDGMLTGPPSGAKEWNPRTSGRTKLTIKPFYQRRTLKITDENIIQFPPILGLRPGDTALHETNGVELALEYDNRDFLVNPTRGSYQRISIGRDFGLFDSTTTWTAMDLQWSKYIGFGEPGFFKQKVFAFRFWTAWSPTFERRQFGDATVVGRSPPNNMGANLGGKNRLRSYPTGRFSDVAAIYYSAELRLMPEWIGFREWPLIRALPMRWWQTVLFGEIGRVAPSYDLGTLHDDMKTTVGVSIRSMVGAKIMRFEFAHGDEANQFWFLTGHSF